MYRIAMIVPKYKSKEELEKELREEMKLKYDNIRNMYEDENYAYNCVEFKTRNELENFCTIYPYDIGKNNIINAYYVHPRNIFLK